HRPADLKRLLNFRHRTFNATDLLYFIRFLKSHYLKSDSLESAFLSAQPGGKKSIHETTPILDPAKGELCRGDLNFSGENEFIKKALSDFYTRFFSLKDAPRRTQKHIASPEKNSTCKRLNMYLRWMVRRDKKGVDFGIWSQITPADLICPVDLHVARVARGFGL